MTEIRLDLTGLRAALAAKNYAQALELLEQLLAQHPEVGRLWVFRSQIALETGDLTGARRYALYALAVGDEDAALNVLSNALKGSGDHRGAFEASELLAKRKGNDAIAAVRAGICAYEAGLIENALEWFAEAGSRDPLLADPWTNQGFVLKAQGDFMRALEAYDEGLRRAPVNADLRWNRALCLLSMGRYAEGLQESEWRWRKASFPSKPRGFTQPLWMGGHVQTLLIHAEQGFGDCIQMLRYIPFAATRVGKVVVEIQPELYRLLCAQKNTAGTGEKLLLGNVELIVQGKDQLPLFDVHVPMMSLPLVLGMVDLDHPPSPGKYLDCPLGIVFKDTADSIKLLNVGIVWRGRPSFAHNHLRSFGLGDMAPLFGVQGVRWFSLQKSPEGDIAVELKEALAPLVDLGPSAMDFLDTGSYLASLDLLITTDTSVAHLAGALGIETWVAVMKVPDWRWGLEGDRCIWYDSIRIFRQDAAGNWAGVFSRMKDALIERLDQSRKMDGDVQN